MGFRKLSDTELENLLGAKKASRQLTKIMPVIREFYERPDDAVSVIVTVDSEYNDEYYRNSPEYAGVYDGKGHEIHPIPGRERDARRRLRDAVDSDDLVRGQSDDPLGDVVIRLNAPELYVKE